MWGTGETLHATNPDMPWNEEIRASWARLERLTSSPRTVALMGPLFAKQDVRAVLPTIRVPTLVLHHTDDAYIPPTQGRYIADRRSEYYLASKCGCLVGAAPAPRGQTSPHVFTRENILKGVEQSLERMRTDHLDVLQFHISPSRATLEKDGALDAVMELKRAGATRFIGMSGTLPNIVDHIAMGVFDVFQIPYSAVEREHEALITRAAAQGAGIVIRGGAAKGAPAEGKHEGVQWERWQNVKLDDLLDGVTPMEFILRFTFTHPAMHTNIVGTIDPEHLRHNVEVLRQGPLPADVYAEAKRRLDAAGSRPHAVQA